jgi:hypothetical protein
MQIAIENPARILPGAISVDFPGSISCLAVQEVLDESERCIRHSKTKTRARRHPHE